MTILDLITTIQHRPDCRVLPPQGLPHIQPHHRLPDDLRLFYAACGGMHLLRETDYPLHIRAPQDVVLTNTILLKGSSESGAARSPTSNQSSGVQTCRLRGAGGHWLRVRQQSRSWVWA